MRPQHQAVEAPEGPPPWSAVSVSIITLLLPAGGAVLTIRNLHRLGQIDAAAAQRQTYATYAVFALGITALFMAAPKPTQGTIQLDSAAQTVLNCGIALASYIVQRLPYHTWRASHRQARPSTWLSGAGWAIVYTLITFALVLPLAVVGMLLGINGSSTSSA